MNKETIEIPLRKATYEELQEVICELQVERCVKDKEIDRLNNIISELEKWLEESKKYGSLVYSEIKEDGSFEEFIKLEEIKNKLKELKEKK